MKLLLDAHAVLWWVNGDERLSATALEHLIDDENDVLLSAVVAWEIAVKRALGKIKGNDAMWEYLAEVDVRELPVTVEHARAVEHLPLHHRDPFDRLLVAQAVSERAVLVSRDSELRLYDVPVIW
ncbi:MAG: type II toxin-antitoxin system VapC family toxin [Solirubrobacteraceae bacterium]